MGTRYAVSGRSQDQVLDVTIIDVTGVCYAVALLHWGLHWRPGNNTPASCGEHRNGGERGGFTPIFPPISSFFYVAAGVFSPGPQIKKRRNRRNNVTMSLGRGLRLLRYLSKNVTEAKQSACCYAVTPGRDQQQRNENECIRTTHCTEGDQ